MYLLGFQHQLGLKRGERHFIYKFIYFIYLFIYLFTKIRHQQSKDKIDNIKNTKAGAVHREELQLRDLKILDELAIND